MAKKKQEDKNLADITPQIRLDMIEVTKCTDAGVIHFVMSNTTIEDVGEVATRLALI